MTTDTASKTASTTYTLSDKTVRTSGVSKDAGMIRPNMATILDFITTGTNMDDAVLQELIRHAADHPLNNVTVDGDIFINDSSVVIATGQTGTPRIDSGSRPDHAALCDMLMGLAQELTQKIVRDGEGVAKFMTTQVRDGHNVEEYCLITYTVVHSPLIKTAFYASDPNLGCTLAIVGYIGVTNLDVDGVNLWLDDVWVARDDGRNPNYREEDGRCVMKQAGITVRIALSCGDASVTVWTCDFSHDYVLINTDYRS